VHNSVVCCFSALAPSSSSSSLHLITFDPYACQEEGTSNLMRPPRVLPHYATDLRRITEGSSARCCYNSARLGGSKGWHYLVVKRPCPIMEEPVISKQSWIGDDNIHVCMAEHARDGVMSGTFAAGTLHQPYLHVGIVARNQCSQWECISASRGWNVVWMAEDSPREVTSSRISFDSLSLPYLLRSKVSVILTDGCLPVIVWLLR
jgi:hypothetical protein